MNITLPNFSNTRVLVVGDIMLDRYWYGDTLRISPEAPVPIVKVGNTENRPGGAGNVALNLAKLGSDVQLLGITGDDALSNELDRLLEDVGVRCELIRNADNETISKLRIISRNQQLIRLDFERSFNRGSHDSLKQCFDQRIGQVDLVILSDYAKGTLSCIQYFIERCRQASVPVLVDPKGTDFSMYSGASLLTPNQSEFEAIVGHCHNEAEICSKAQELIARLGIGALVITRSEQGIAIIRADGQSQFVHAQTREVYDVTGAGDTVIAVIGAALAAGSPLEAAAHLANVAAGVVVGKLGTASVETDELKAALHSSTEAPKSLPGIDDLLSKVTASQAIDERIVFTNGCFDVIHAGHVSYLAKAAKLGNRLIVAVNSDDSVERLKGADRPINSLQDRIAVLAAMRCIDWIISFDSDTPLELIKAIRPDVLVKGGDYALSDVVGADDVHEKGGEVVLIDFIDNKSTTNMINKIKNKGSSDGSF